MSSDEVNQPRRILIIRPTALGDVARTVPALVTLRQAHPQAQIDWLVHESFVDVVRHHPALSGVVPFPRQRFARPWRPQVAREIARWLKGLKRAQYDLVLDLQGLLRSGLFTWMTRSPRRVGYANAAELAWLGYNEKHAVDRRLHAVDRTLGLLAALGYPPQCDLTLYSSADDRQWVGRLIPDDEPYVVVAPVARWRSKTWPPERYVSLIERLLATAAAGRRVVVLASPAERDIVEPILLRFEHEPRVMAPRSSVGQMMALIERARLVVCNDSGPLHVAVGFKRPIAAIFGPTDPSLVGPYGRDDAVVQPPGLGAMGARAYRRNPDDQTLIAQVTVSAVWQCIERQLALPTSAPTP